MKRRMHPVRVALAVGLPVGVLLALVVMIAGRTQSGMSTIQDGLLALVLGVLVFGGFAGFVQYQLISRNSTPEAEPGWYDSPADDGTQWYWDGSRWTDDTRTAPKRAQQPR